MKPEERTSVLLPTNGDMKNISFVRYSPFTNNRTLTAQVVECYRKVFADAPWNEWKQCPTCKASWGTEDKALLESRSYQCCNTNLVDFWPQEQVAVDLRQEVTDKASCWLAMCGSEVIGFCWGYPIRVDDLEKKLGISLGLNPIQEVAYQDDAGVLAPYRRQKIATAMIRRQLSDFLAQGLQDCIGRTRESPEPSKTYPWFKRLGYRILARYPNGDGRVVMARKIEGLSSRL